MTDELYAEFMVNNHGSISLVRSQLLNKLAVQYFNSLLGCYCIEQFLKVLLAATGVIAFKSKTFTKQEYLRMRSRHNQMTMGTLLKEVKRKCQLSDSLTHQLDKALIDRNYLIHHFPADHFTHMDDKQVDETIRLLGDKYNYFDNVYRQLQQTVDKIRSA